MTLKVLKLMAVPVLVAAASVTASAVPAKPGVLQYPSADGSTVSVTLHGDEFGHYYLSADGYPLVAGKDHNLYYVKMEQGVPVSSGVRANDPGMRSASELSFISRLDREAVTRAVVQMNDAARQAAAARRSGQKPAKAPVTGLICDYPTLGSPNAMILLVEFSDIKFKTENPHEAFNDLINKEGYDYNGATGSAKDYYRDNSNGRFNPNFQVFGPVTVPHGEAYYGASSASAYDAQAWLMISDAVQELHKQQPDLDWSQFDNDGDGFVDSIFVFYAGYGQNEGAPDWTIWPHSANLYTYYGIDIEYNGVRMGNYACTNELRGTKGTTRAGIGTFCHEYGHVLGLPDIYPTSGGSGFSPGAFEVMDHGSYNNNGNTPPQLSAYDRFSLGWLNPRQLSGPEDITLKPLEEGEALVITTEKDEEYFILENRQQKGWDSYIPGHGMLIWHIDFDQQIWIDNKVNKQYDHQRVDLIEADNVFTEATRGGDPFPGTGNVRSFTANSTPAMKTWIGVDPDMPITDIYEVDGLITFKVKGGGDRLDAPVAVDAVSVAPTSFTASWESVKGVHQYQVDVCLAPSVVPFTTLTVKEATSVEVTGLQPSTEYMYAVRAIDGDRVSPNSNMVHVTTLPPTFDMGVVEVLPATSVYGDNFTAAWTPLEGAAGYLIDVFTKQSVDPRYMSADFTKDEDGTFLPEGWSASSNATGSLSGYYGEAAPSLRLSNNNDRLSAPVLTDEYINSISFWCRGNSTGDDASVGVEALVGGTWQTVYTLSPVGRTATTVRLGEGDDTQGRLPDFARGVRIVFNKNGNGALYVDDVKVGYGATYNNVLLDGFNGLDAGNVSSYKVGGLQPYTTYYYTVKAYNVDGLKTLPSKEIQVQTIDPGSVNGSEAVAASVSRHGSTLFITSGHLAPFGIYSVSGACVASGMVAPDSSRSVELAPGAYVVTVGGRRFKVVM